MIAERWEVSAVGATEASVFFDKRSAAVGHAANVARYVEDVSFVKVYRQVLRSVSPRGCAGRPLWQCVQWRRVESVVWFAGMS